ncbi:hypothetical protein ACROYT_G039410 [Oculina patagonica]
MLFLERPEITVKPQDQELKKDESAMLNCKATSIPPSKISWLKTGPAYRYGRYSIEENARVFVLSNGSLVITKLKFEDSCVYLCTAYNDGGWSDSAEAELTVIGICNSVQLSIQPPGNTFLTGTDLQLWCKCDIYPLGTYTWTKNGVPVAQDGRVTVSRNKLLINNATEGDSGKYECKATTKDGSTTKSSPTPLSITVVGICNSVQLSIQPPRNTFRTGTDLQLLCKCYIYPLGTYTWTKNSVPVVHDGRVTVSQNKLSINNATEGDSGKYECKATTKDGSTTKSSSTPLSVTVVVRKQPQFLVPPPAEVVVLEGSQTLIPCKAIGSPVPDINWYTTYASYYGRVHWSQLRDNSKYTIHENGSLVIRNVNKQDTLKYKCIASNLVARIAAETIVKIAYLDDLVLYRNKMYVLHNHETEVYCKPRGHPEPTITWQKVDNQPLPKTFAVEGCCTLKKTRTKLSDSGNYTCIAKNMLGTKTINVEIIVSEQPEIIVKPQDQELKVDESAMLNCKATSRPPSKISWSKDYWWNAIKGDARIFVLSNGSLVITKLRPKDSGFYRCSADHDGGWSDSAEAKLTVMAKVKLAGIHNNQINANPHKPQKIRCDFEGHEPITVTWKKGDGSAPLDKPRVKQDGSVLFFAHFEKEDAGQYWCRGENGFSSAESYVNITVFVYPAFDLRPKNTTARVNDHLWIHCNATGNPKPKIRWSKEQKNGDKLDKDRFIQHPNGTLQIKNVRLEDQGWYYCIAANHAEMKHSKFSLVVQTKVKLAGFHNNQINANLHKPQKIKCDFEGHEPITVTWKKGDGSAPLDKPRVKQDGRILFFAHFEKEDAGQYWCKGENWFSSAEAYVNVTAFGKEILRFDIVESRILEPSIS